MHSKQLWRKNSLYSCSLIFIFFVKLRHFSNHLDFSKLRKKQFLIIDDITSNYRYYFTREFFSNIKPSSIDKFLYNLAGTFHRFIKTENLSRFMARYLKIIKPDSRPKHMWVEIKYSFKNFFIYKKKNKKNRTYWSSLCWY